MSFAKQLNQYQEQAINSMTKGEVLIKLFDEALKNAKFAVTLMREGNNEASLKCSTKVKNIFVHLNSILDPEYEISNDLRRLYTFINVEVISGEAKKDPEIINGIIPLIEDLRDTWSQAEKLVHIQHQQQ